MSSDALAAPAPASNNAVVAAATRVRDAGKALLASARPWSEMADRASFSRPADLAEATTRLRKNAAYFKINYALLTAGITAATVALNPAALIVLAALSAAWTWLTAIRTSPVVINGRTLSERETVLAASAASVVVVFFLTSAGTVLFSALGLSAAAVAAHGALRAPDDLFTDEPVEAPGGLLGMLTGGLGAARPVAAAV